MCQANKSFYQLLRRDQTSITLLDKSSLKELRYEILRSVKFTPERKMHSVLVRSPGGELFLLSKGADEVIFNRGARGQNELKMQA